MFNEQEIQGILSIILTKYKSFEETQFFFVEEAMAQRPYDNIIRELEQTFLIEEDTDLNIDVSFHYVLTKGENKWSLQLSMIGQYAVIWRIVKVGQTFEVIDPTVKALSPQEQILMQVLQSKSIQVLDEDTLIYPVSLKLLYTEPEHTKIYQALFGDYDPLPWR